MAYQEVLSALADPTRQQILERLREGPKPVGLLACDLPISRPAVSQHLRVLSDAGLVAVEPEGTRRLYRLAPEGWRELKEYLDTMWEDALAAFAQEAAQMSKEK